MDDQAAIELCLAGDANAFRHIVERYQNEAMGHALAILRNREDAEDAAQEAFVKAFRALGRFEAGRHFYPWFYTILRNCCLKSAARRPSVGGELDPLPGILAAPPAGECEQNARLLEQALGRLSVADRELITLKHLDGLSYEALAERVGIPAGTVMSRLYHARKRLRVEIDHLSEET
jgi:RNA polymerase sigma-70 factor (ECF subfamily)